MRNTLGKRQVGWDSTDLPALQLRALSARAVYCRCRRHAMTPAHVSKHCWQCRTPQACQKLAWLEPLLRCPFLSLLGDTVRGDTVRESAWSSQLERWQQQVADWELQPLAASGWLGADLPDETEIVWELGDSYSAINEWLCTMD